MNDPYQYNTGTAPVAPPTRNIIIRICAAIFWLIVTYVVVQMIAGGIVGGIAGAKLEPGHTQDAAKVGAEASMRFMEQHGLKLLLGELALWLGLTLTGKFPWVSKYRK